MDKEKTSQIYFQINDVCNQHCIFCNRPPRGSEVSAISLKDAKKRIDKIVEDKSVTRIIFTGGEPTMHPELKEIVRYSADKGITTEIQTNGTVLEEEDYKELKTAGLSIVNFAWHSHEEEKSCLMRGVNFGFEKIERSIMAAAKAGLCVHVIHVINKVNYADLSEFIDRIKEIGLNRFDMWLNLSLVVPDEFAWQNRDEVVPSHGEVKPYLIEACGKCVEYRMPFDISEIVPLCIVPGFEDRVVSTVFMTDGIVITDDYDEGKRLLDFSIKDDRTMKAPQCESCSLSPICTGFYPKIAEMYGMGDYVPSTKDPAEIIKIIQNK